MRQGIHPIPLTNAKFNAYAAIHEAEEAIARRVGELNDTLGAIAYRLEKLCDRLPERDDWVAYMGRDNNSADDLDKLCKAIERRDRNRVDNVAALCAAGFSVSGDIDESTRAGKWLHRAGDQLKITDLTGIAELTGQPRRRRSFVAKLLDSASSFEGLPTRLTQEEIERFIDMSPSLLAAMGPAGDEEEPPDTPPEQSDAA